MAEDDTAMSTLIASLPLKEVGSSHRLRKYKDIWFPEAFLPGIISAKDQYKPRDTDILLASPSKCGTTWLKALAFAIVNRHCHQPSSQGHPLLLNNPHGVVPYVEWAFREQQDYLDSIPPPRLLATHLAYSLLPEQVNASGCRIIFICRDPKDQLVSGWYFYDKIRVPVPLGVFFHRFCEGVFPHGPVWDHALDYWRESVERPHKVLFLTYEDLVGEGGAVANVRRMAEFMGCPFSESEEREGVVEEIVRLCSFGNLKGLEVNNTGVDKVGLENSSFFRKGRVGDWKNHLTAEMARKVDEITRNKLLATPLYKLWQS